MKASLPASFFIFCMAAFTTHAYPGLVDTSPTVAHNVSLKLSGAVGFSFVHIVKSSAWPRLDAPTDVHYLDGAWLNTFRGHVSLQSRIGDRVLFTSGINGGVWQPIQTPDGRKSGQKRSAGAYPSAAHVRILLGDTAQPALHMTAGFFGYNPSPAMRDFGGYLYKAGCYPGYLYSGDTTTLITGFKLTTNEKKPVHQDILVTIETERYPYFDISFGNVTHVRTPAIHMSAGVLLYRLIPADDARTHPVGYGTWVDAKTGREQPYSLSGTKIMAAFRLDPKALLSSRGRLGRDDLVIYGEAGILGLRNYPLSQSVSFQSSVDAAGNTRVDTIRTAVGYPTLRQRIPVAIGLNLPVFKLLDYCAVEVEYYGSPYFNNPTADNNPLPRAIPAQWHSGHQDDGKWAVLAGRRISHGITLTGRVASDHLRTVDESGFPEPLSKLFAPDEWYWSLGMEAGF